SRSSPSPGRNPERVHCRRVPGYPPWTKVVGHEDTVLDLEVHGSQAYGMTKGGTQGPVGNGRVLGFDLAKESFANAHVVVPESSLILSAQRGTGLRLALDALYVY